jgi:hypothetical protein
VDIDPGVEMAEDIVIAVDSTVSFPEIISHYSAQKWTERFLEKYNQALQGEA